MFMYKSLNLLEPMDEVVSVVGNPVKGSGFYGHSTGLHTVAIRVQNFQGRISIQASIVNTPSSDADWFTVLPGNVPYIQYPRNPYVIIPPSHGETSIFGFNFMVNAIWLRASVNRDYIIPPSSNMTYQKMYISTFGLVDSILVNY